jgi:hypothetical protein
VVILFSAAGCGRYCRGIAKQTASRAPDRLDPPLQRIKVFLVEVA